VDLNFGLTLNLEAKMDPVAFAKLLKTKAKRNLSRKQICAEFGIKLNSYDYLLRRHKRRESAKNVVAKTTKQPKSNFVQIKPKPSDFDAAMVSDLAFKNHCVIEVITPKGFTLRIPADFNEETLYRTLRILEF
jgi:hypothetical protein